MARLNQNPYPVFDGTGLRSPVLFVVDMVNGFIKEGDLADPAILACAAPIRDLMESLHPQIWFVNDAHDPNCAEFRAFPPHCIRGTSQSEVIDELAGYSGQILEKNAISAAASEKYFQMLSSLPEACDLIVAGCCTDLCIEQLALPLQSWIHQNNRTDCRVIVPVDCVDTYHIPKVHDARFWNETALASLALNGVQVVSSIALEPGEKKE